MSGLLVLRRRSTPLAAVLAVAAIVQLVPLAGPTLLSTDAWTYWMYGRVSATLDANAYADAPSSFPDDVAFGAMGSSWQDTPSLYGPLFTLVSEVHAKAVGEDTERAAWLYRLIASFATLGSAALVASFAARPGFAAAFVGWNPLLALHFGGGGHNDALMMLFVVGALALAARGSSNIAGVCWVAAIGVKWVAGAFLVLWAIQRFARRETIGWRGLVAGTAALVVIATERYGTAWIDALGGLSSQARRTGSIGLSKWLGDLGLGHRATLITIGLATVIVFAWLAREAWLRRARLGVAGSALALGQGWLNPWYASWGVELSAGEDDRLAHVLAIGLTGFLLLDVLPR